MGFDGQNIWGATGFQGNLSTGGYDVNTYPGVYFDTTDSKIKYSQNKTFVIDHPIQHDKYLVHACLEGPEAGVYYRGVEVVDEELIVKLPNYASKIATDYSVQATQIKGKHEQFAQIATSKIENNCFTIYTSCKCKVSWYVVGRRSEIDVEPDKHNLIVRGDGPYKYYVTTENN